MRQYAGFSRRINIEVSGRDTRGHMTSSLKSKNGMFRLDGEGGLKRVLALCVWKFLITTILLCFF